MWGHYHIQTICEKTFTTMWGLLPQLILGNTFKTPIHIMCGHGCNQSMCQGRIQDLGKGGGLHRALHIKMDGQFQTFCSYYMRTVLQPDIMWEHYHILWEHSQPIHTPITLWSLDKIYTCSSRELSMCLSNYTIKSVFTLKSHHFLMSSTTSLPNWSSEREILT
jgi:hypothetical protein